MLDIKNPASDIGTLPPAFQEVLYWRITVKPVRVILLQFGAVLCLFIFWLIFSRLGTQLGWLPVSGSFGIKEIGMVFIGILLIFILHELTHGLVMQLFGAKARYGIAWKQLMFYATSPGFPFQRNDYLVVVLAPVVLITLLVVVGMGIWAGTAWVPLIGICGILNASGALGDIWVSMILLGYPKTALVMDERDGVRVFLHQE